MGTIKIKISELEMHEEDHTPVEAKCFYDPHIRLWAVYPIDALGTQLSEARFGYGKKEALQIKAEIEESISNGTIDRSSLYYEF